MASPTQTRKRMRRYSRTQSTQGPRVQYESWKSKHFHLFRLHGTDTEWNRTVNELRGKNGDKELESHVRTSCVLLLPQPPCHAPTLFYIGLTVPLHIYVNYFNRKAAIQPGAAIFCPHTASFGPSLVGVTSSALSSLHHCPFSTLFVPLQYPRYTSRYAFVREYRYNPAGSVAFVLEDEHPPFGVLAEHHSAITYSYII